MKRTNFVSLKQVESSSSSSDDDDDDEDRLEEMEESDKSDQASNGIDDSGSGSDSDDSDEDKDDFSITGAGLKRPADDDKTAQPQKKVKGITVDELKRLEETENLYHSNMFRMQIDELLKEVKCPSSVNQALESYLEEFNESLTSGLVMEGKTFQEITQSDVVYPLNTKVQDLSKTTFEYRPPKEDAQIFGSQKYGTNIGETLFIDLVINMPFVMFHKEDYLNERYFHKKSFYLQTIAKKLQRRPSIKEVKFNYFKNDHLRPVLEVIPNLDIQKSIKILIHVVPSEDTFKLNRYLPSTNNVRPYLALSEEELICPTPHYNYGILFDLTAYKNDKFIADIIEDHSEVKNAIILLKIWLKQRHFDEGFYPFDGYLITMYICHLLKTGIIFPAMSSYQIIRLVWFHLSKSNWDKEGITLCSFIWDANRPSLQDFHDHFDVVFVDSTGYMNICSNLSLDLYYRIKDESARAIKCLDNKKADSFHHLFMQKLPPYLQYDQILIIKNYFNINRIVGEHSQLEDKLNYCDNWYPLLRKLVMKILKKGLRDRVSHIVPFTTSITPWAITEPYYLKSEIMIGLILNPSEAFTIVDKGPQANEIESKEFREFWGEKSELRRFQDGSITESCVWSTMDAPVGEKRLICKKICFHLLTKHFNVPNICMHYVANQFDVAIRTRSIKENDTGEGRALKAIHTFDELSKEMRNITSIPLTITTVLGVDPVFRYCDLETPLPNGKKFEWEGVTGIMASKSISAVFQLASSGKWPNEIEALRKMKTAFYLQIATALRSSLPEAMIQVYNNYFYVLLNGFVYKLELVHPKELLLLRETLDKNKITKIYKDNEKSIQLEKRGLMLPKLTSTLHGLHSQHTSFGPAVNMTKRWLFSQMIDNHLWPEECTELIMAHLFLRPNDLPPPMQPQTAFFRLLTYLAQTEFETEMIVVNFNSSLEEDVLKQLDKRFTTDRSSLPPLCLVTSCDFGKYSIWSKKAPSKEILRRIQLLAKNAIKLVEDDLHILCPKRIKPIFTPSLTGYNVLIEVLETVLVPSYTIPVDRFTSCKQEFSEKKLQAVDFNAAQIYLRELRQAFDKYALFFYDPCEGNKIAVLWKPNAFNTTENVKNGSKKAMKGRKKLDEIIQEFQSMGKGFVKKVEVLTDRVQC